MQRKTKEQREYLLKLKDEISSFLVNYKKRYQRFPWSQVNKVPKLKLYTSVPITVNGTKFTVKELVKIINSTKKRINGKLKPSSYNYILKAYIKDSYKKSGSNLKSIYNTYHIELQKVFKELEQDLMFCLTGLRELNKTLKSIDSKKKYTKESVDISDDDLNFKTPEDLHRWMVKNLKYDNNRNWKLRSTEEVIKDKKGNCHDQALFARKYLSKMKGIKDVGCIFLMEFKGDKLENCGTTHTLTYFSKNGKFYWFENAWESQSGIHGPYGSTLMEMMNDIHRKWEWSSNYNKLLHRKLAKVDSGMDLEKYCTACIPNRKIFEKDYYAKESEEYDMSDYDLLPECMESDLDETLLTEGGDRDLYVELQILKRDYKNIINKYKTHIKNNEFDKAKRDIKLLNKTIDKSEKTIKNIDSSVGDVFLTTAVYLIKDMILMSLSIKSGLKVASRLSNDYYNSDDNQNVSMDYIRKLKVIRNDFYEYDTKEENDEMERKTKELDES